MAKIALYRKYRPNNFDELFGQDHISKTLKNAVATGNFSHAYLFYGPRGTGKTSVARILAKSVNCLDPKEGNPCNKCDNCLLITENRALDIIEIDAASHTQVDNIREVIIDRANFAPTKLKFKIYIIDEAHMLSKSSFNALLKTLEEPPEHTLFILATTEAHKIIPTIQSRCQRFDFRRIESEVVKKRLADIATLEKIEITEEALALIAKSSEGGFRDAISLLDQLSVNEKEITATSINGLNGSINHKLVFEYLEYLFAKDTAKTIATINNAVAEGYDFNVFYNEILESLRNLMIASAVGVDELKLLKNDAKSYQDILVNINLLEIIKAIEILVKTNETKNFALPQLSLEIGSIKYISGIEAAVPAQQSTSQSQKTEGAKSVTDVVKKPVQHTGGKWQEFLLEVKSTNSSVHAFLKVCEPEFSETDALLSFPYKFHKERIEDTKNRQIVENALNKVYGKDYRVKCKLHALSTRSTRADEKPMKDDLLDEALEIFGGEVTE